MQLVGLDNPFPSTNVSAEHKLKTGKHFPVLSPDFISGHPEIRCAEKVRSDIKHKQTIVLCR